MYFHISSEKFRSTNLARLDGVEQTALILGVSLSPYAFHYWGYVGCFIFRVIGGLLAIAYLSKVFTISIFKSFTFIYQLPTVKACSCPFKSKQIQIWALKWSTTYPCTLRGLKIEVHNFHSILYKYGQQSLTWSPKILGFTMWKVM